jgi:glycosyltransferase involved in cell wall biosynthesis
LKVSVVISYVNAARTLGRCLQSIADQDYDDFQFVLVDGGSTDGSIQIARRRGIEPMIVKGCSEAKGQILGVESTNSDLICFTNSDCYVPRDWLARHVEWHERGYDMVGGKLFWGGDRYGFSWSYFTPKNPSDSLTSGLSLGWSNCSISRALYDEVGINDIQSQQDMDFWIRATKLGAKFIMDPKIEVYHDHPMRSVLGSFKRAFGYGRNHVLLLRNGYGRGPWPNYQMFPYSLYILQEILGIRGTKIWKQQVQTAAAHGISVSLPRFLALRLVGFSIPMRLGSASAMLNPVGSTDKVQVGDAHRWGR